MGGDWARSHDPISSLNETETYAVPKVSPIPTNREEGTMNEQIKILEEIQKKGFNAITCSMCGEVNLVRLANEMFTCYACEEKQQHHDCADLFF